MGFMPDPVSPSSLPEVDINEAGFRPFPLQDVVANQRSDSPHFHSFRTMSSGAAPVHSNPLAPV